MAVDRKIKTFRLMIEKKAESGGKQNQNFRTLTEGPSGLEVVTKSGLITVFQEINVRLH